jgi:RinA family phage transcriptional activator
MQGIKLKRGTFQHVESELYAYHDTKKEIMRLKNDILFASAPPDDNIGAGRGNRPGDPTGRTAILLTTHRRIEQLERIVDAIETVVDRLPDKKKQLVQLRYWSKHSALTWDGIAMRLEIGRATAIRWRDEIVFAIADKIGWR